MPLTSGQAMVLAAGRGERMRPLTDTCPKPLLRVRGKPLLQWQLEGLAHGDFQGVVINTAWLGVQIEEHFGFEPSWEGLDSLSKQKHLQIAYSHEELDFGGALETAGGIVRALRCWPRRSGWLPGTFSCRISGSHSGRTSALARARCWRTFGLCQIPSTTQTVISDWPPSAQTGSDLREPGACPMDFFDNRAVSKGLFGLPFCGIPPGNPLGVKAPLAPLLRAAMDNGLVSAELYRGEWTDVGTPQRLAQLNNSQ